MGKSLLLKLLAVYFREHNIPFDTVDWNTSEEALWDRLNGNTLKSKGSYLLYDNGDITLTPEVYSKLTGLPCTSIISMKRIQRVDCGLYDVIYNPGDLRVEKYFKFAAGSANLRKVIQTLNEEVYVDVVLDNTETVTTYGELVRTFRRNKSVHIIPIPCIETFYKALLNTSKYICTQYCRELRESLRKQGRSSISISLEEFHQLQRLLYDKMSSDLGLKMKLKI